MSEDQNRTLQDKFMLRLPDGMRERIKAAAEANNRSMNAEIVATLEEKYPAPRGVKPGKMLQLLAKIEVVRRKWQKVESEEKAAELQDQYDDLMDQLRSMLAELEAASGQG